MEQTAGEEGRPATQADRYAIIADEIRGLSQDVTGSLLNVLSELAKSNPGSAYIAAKRHVERHGFLLLDEGYVGVSDGFVLGANEEYLMCPGDIVVYAMITKLATGDTLLAFYFSKSGSVGLYHCAVLSFNPKGGVEVRDAGDGKIYWVSPERILGKIAKVVHFGDAEWHELIGHLMSKKHLVESLTKHSKRVEESGHPDKSKRNDELKRRLAILTAGQP